jgi:ribose 1,5-bisphosphokinase
VGIEDLGVRTGPLVYVMGPSGVGKDSLLRFAREALAPGERIAFAHRYITRPADSLGENHVALSAAEFETRVAAGLFAFHWAANGWRYGIGSEITAWQHAGFVVVVSGSRGHFLSLQPQPPGLIPVLVTTAHDALRRRLVARGRESGAVIAARLARADAYAVDDPHLVTIDNSGPLEEGGAKLLALLRNLAAG